MPLRRELLSKSTVAGPHVLRDDRSHKYLRIEPVPHAHMLHAPCERITNHVSNRPQDKYARCAVVTLTRRQKGAEDRLVNGLVHLTTGQDRCRRLASCMQHSRQMRPLPKS